MPISTGCLFLSSRKLHLPPHSLNCVFQARENGLPDQEMTDVQLSELGDGRNRTDIVMREAMPGVGFDTVLGGERGSIRDPSQFCGSRGAVDMGVTAGVEFHHWCPQPDGRVHLPRVRLNEQADANARIDQQSHEGR